MSSDSSIVGQILPQLDQDSFEFAAGQPFEINNAGKPLLIEAFATWCPACVQTVSVLNGLSKKYSGKLAILGVTTEPLSKLETFLKSHPVSYCVASNPNADVETKLMQPAKVEGIPHSFLVDAEKKIVWEGHPSDPQLQTQVSSCLVETGSPKGDMNAPKPAARPKKNQKEILLPRITEMREELLAKPIKVLAKILDERNISREGIIDKEELVDLILQRCSGSVQYFQYQEE